MTRKPEIRSINCTACGAGLDVLGGGRVQVHVCGYCGSELDAQDDYVVLRKFADIPRPPSPFAIGMQGQIDGVTFTIIGTLGMKETWGRQTWIWVDHQIYSPTHGYAYLTVEDGHVTFTRRHRYGTRPRWISPYSVEIAETRPTVTSDGAWYQYFETTTSEVTFVEGEFNWCPRVGLTAQSVSAYGDGKMLSFQSSDEEEEITITRYLPAEEVYAAFGVETPPKVTGFHALLPYLKGRHEEFLKWSAAACAAAAVVVGLVLNTGSQSAEVTNDQFRIRSLPAEIPLAITEPGKLASIRVSADVNNSWAYITLDLFDPEDAPVFEAGRTVERYHGRDADGSWSEGRGHSTLRFIPEQAGLYTLEVDVEEAATWVRSGDPISAVTVQTREGLVSGFWMYMVALGFGVFALYHLARPVLHHQRRMWLSDWSDDD